MTAIALSEIKIDRASVTDHVDAVAEKLRQYGVLVVPGMIDAATTAQLDKEYDALLEAPAPYVRKVDYSNGRAVTVKMDELDGAKFPGTTKFFRAPYFEKLTQVYLGQENVHANQTVYIVNDIVGNSHHANDLHFDVQRSLKFFIYLTDTTAENGAFSCVPGSHHISNKMRYDLGKKLNYENRELSRKLPVEEKDAIPIEGTAGTLIIFDTDVFHRAGYVTKGERRVMRGQSNFDEALNYPGEKREGKSFFAKLFGK